MPGHAWNSDAAGLESEAVAENAGLAQVESKLAAESVAPGHAKDDVKLSPSFHFVSARVEDSADTALGRAVIGGGIKGRLVDNAVLIVRTLAGEVIFEVPESKLSWLSSLPIKEHICRQQQVSADKCILADGECQIELGTRLKEILQHHSGGTKELTFIQAMQSPPISVATSFSSHGSGIRCTMYEINGTRLV